MAALAVMLLKRIWAAPMSLLGLLLAPFFATSRVTNGILLCEGAEWPRRLGWRYRAITLGHVVLAIDDPISPAVLAHELVHVRQCERWGIAFLPAYLGASLWALVTGRRPYADNAFEKAARVHGPRPGRGLRRSTRHAD